MTAIPTGLIAALMCLSPALPGQTHADAPPRGGLSAGMGVEYVSAPDVASLVNPLNQGVQFRAAVEFFGALAMPLSDLWILKLEYAYELSSSSAAVAFGQASFDEGIHLPSLILQYVLVDRGVYNLKLGAGGGYHFGSLAESYPSFNDTFSGGGPGMVAELEANTAFGDHLYMFLGANIRWELVGTLHDASGVPLRTSAFGPVVTLHSFGAGVRLGASYLF